MSLQQTLQQRLTSAQALLHRAEQLCAGVQGHQKLCSKLRAELRFLHRVEAGELQVKQSHLCSTNLTHLSAIVASAESLGRLEALLHVFSWRGPGGDRRTLVVDVVADGGLTWVKAVGRKAQALHNIWQGRGQYGDKSIISQAEDFLAAASQQPVQYTVPSVVFSFYSGVSVPMATRLRDMGVTVRGEEVSINRAEEEDEETEEDEDEETEDNPDPSHVTSGPVPPEPSLCVGLGLGLAPLQPGLGSIPPLRANLDITTLITLVSSLSHGRCCFSFKEPVLTEQAAQERQLKILPQLEAFMAGKQLFACRAAVSDFQLILQTLGGRLERERAEQLLKRVTVVEDKPSERTRALKHSAKVTERSISIFGTGDSLRAVTMTANSRFVRAAANQGVRYSVFIHQPRALTEGKEWRATPI